MLSERSNYFSRLWVGIIKWKSCKLGKVKFTPGNIRNMTELNNLPHTCEKSGKMRPDKIQGDQIKSEKPRSWCLLFFSLKLMTKVSVVSGGAGLCCPKGSTIVQLWGWKISPSSGAEGDRGKAQVVLHHLPSSSSPLPPKGGLNTKKKTCNLNRLVLNLKAVHTQPKG